jgi:hypothetical protein
MGNTQNQKAQERIYDETIKKHIEVLKEEGLNLVAGPVTS